MDRKICEATKPKIVTILSGNEIMAEDWGRFSDHLGILSHHIVELKRKAKNLTTYDLFSAIIAYFIFAKGKEFIAASSHP